MKNYTYIIKLFTEPPKAANVHVTQTTASSLTIRWRVTDDGQSPINRVAVNYKMTYGEWVNEELGMVSNKMAIITIFGHKNLTPKFYQ